MFKFFSKNNPDKVIRLVYPKDTHLCPNCGAYVKNKVCSRCKKINK
jgi:exosome complex RNA-binding protein Csl4